MPNLRTAVQPGTSGDAVVNSIDTDAVSKPNLMANNRGRRGLTKKDRISPNLNWHSTERPFREAVTAVQRSGVLPPIKEYLGRRRDAEARISIEGTLVALVINARHEGHKGAVTWIMRLLNGFSATKRLELGMPAWREVGVYDRTQRILAAIAGALDHGWDHVDRETGEMTRCNWAWFWVCVIRAPIPDELMAAMKGNIGIAVDGTEVETCGAFQFGYEKIVVDGDGPHADAFVDTKKVTGAKSKQAPKCKAPMKTGWPKRGPDNRKVYTKDVDARAGLRSANANHEAGSTSVVNFTSPWRSRLTRTACSRPPSNPTSLTLSLPPTLCRQALIRRNQ